MNEQAPSLLIVDDNEDNRYTLMRRLKREGYENLAWADNGQTALERLRAESYDLVLLDIMMPVMNGHDTLEAMKQDMHLREIPVIMISAVDEMDSIVRCIEAGAEDHLVKPFNAALLRARIRSSLDRKKLRDQQTEYLKQIEHEKKRGDDLLHATLPAAAVHELKATAGVRPRRFEDVVVLFCDVVGFTGYCDEHQPEEVVAHLQAFVLDCEAIVERHGLEKIKTVGDAFMATAGLLKHVDKRALASVSAAFDMIEAARKRDSGWKVRVGIHSGPVVGGVVGKRMYCFDVWGDTVNVADRITSSARADAVLVSAPVWRTLDDACSGQSRGLVELKGKGSVELIECMALL
ncbi:adenylate/guanylate cyclase domain-containing protein [Granulosicoccus sp. 3-233]|uniref:adenylate/guanylate cyclase domain-containing protein n=1 Tax=Granulosicoccus sp. 3-233 TaxID=3417969 RepID=UPI003D337469